MNVSKITVEELKKCIAHFEKLSDTYFWNPPSNAAGRRAEEKKNSQKWEFEIDGKKVLASVAVSCSCRNYYSIRIVTIGEERKRMMVPFLKKCLAALEQQNTNQCCKITN
jgi:hypothetical protein